MYSGVAIHYFTIHTTLFAVCCDVTYIRGIG